MSEVEVGQIWADNDSRERKAGRRQRLEVMGYEDFGAKRKIKLRNQETGKETLVNLDRMKPTSRGYRLIGYRDVPDDEGMPRTLLGKEMAQHAMSLERYLHRHQNKKGIQTCEHPEACDFLTMFPARLRAIEDEASE